MAKQQAPNLRIITENNLFDAYGDPIAPFRLSLTSDSYLEFECCVVNDGDAVWSSGDPALFPERYLSLTPYNLKGFIHAEVQSNGAFVTSADPILFDVWGTVPLSGALTPPDADKFTGFEIAPKWVNKTTENNVGAIGAPAGRIQLASPLSPGDYKLLVTLDPNNWWGQQKTYSLTFTVAGAALASNTALRVRGKK